MKVIAVVNQKGGCGKTTVSINLASALAEEGKNVLLVDMDPQSHCAVGLAVPEEQIEQSIYDVLISTSRNEPLRLQEILWQITDRMELAPASIDLSAYDQQMSGIAERELCLKKILDAVQNNYDYVIIDCPPAVGLLTFSALRAATDVIVPVETGYFALHGLSKQLDTLSILCRRCNHNISVKVLASMYDIRTKMAREILAELRNHFEEKMFKTVVNFNTKLKEAASLGQPISEYDPASKGMKNFKALADEVIQMHEASQATELVNTLAGQLESISASADELITNADIDLESFNKAIEEIAQSTEDPELAEIAEGEIRIIDEPEPIKLLDEDQSTETLEIKSAAEHDFMLTDEKIADYYGVNQIDDAVVFVSLYPRASQVMLAGDFNDWQPEKTSMEKVGQTGAWKAKLNLPSGKYRYRLVVDGQWMHDPYNEITEMNPFGEYNSILEVK
jgi:chromosome partitioning protein